MTQVLKHELGGELGWGKFKIILVLSYRVEGEKWLDTIKIRREGVTEKKVNMPVQV